MSLIKNKRKKELNFDNLYHGYIKEHGSKNKARKKTMSLLEDKTVIRANSRLIEGHIYQFEYFPIHKDTLNYYDNKPLILCLGPSRKYKHLDLGINLNFLPPKYKYFLLKSIYKYNRNNIYKVLNGKNSMIVSNYEFLKRIVPRELSFAIRMYDFRKKKNVKEVMFDEWHKVVLLEIGDFYNITLSQIYKMWRKNK